MMTCRDVIDRFLLDFVEGTLPAGEAAAFGEHLSICPSCVAYVESYRRTIEMSKRASAPETAGSGSPPPAPPEELVQAILKVRRSRG